MLCCSCTIDQSSSKKPLDNLFVELVYVTNLISFDKGNNLQLTYSFVGGIPGIADPGPSVSLKEMSQEVGFSVEKSIAKIRELVKEGLL